MAGTIQFGTYAYSLIMNSSESGTCLPSEVLNSLRAETLSFASRVLPSVAGKMINSLSVYFKCATPRQTGGQVLGIQEEAIQTSLSS